MLDVESILKSEDTMLVWNNVCLEGFHCLYGSQKAPSQCGMIQSILYLIAYFQNKCNGEVRNQAKQPIFFRNR